MELVSLVCDGENDCMQMGRWECTQPGPVLPWAQHPRAGVRGQEPQGQLRVRGWGWDLSRGSALSEGPLGLKVTKG